MHEPTPFGHRLRQRRREAGLSQEALAERASVSTRAITELERGVVRAPRRDTLEMLADALDLDADQRDQWRQLRQESSLRKPVPRREHPESALSPVRSALIGRSADLERLIELVRPPGERFVTLTGPGGVGKTSLAIEAVRALEPDFPNGAVFVDLSTIRKPEQVFPSISAMLGIGESGSETHEERTFEYLERRSILLVFDNFEHVLSAAPDVATLLERSPRSSVLVTSRSRLRVHSEQVFTIKALGVADPIAGATFEEIEQSPAVQLFVDRARRVDPDFALTEDNAQDVLAICAHLDGLPLAIELAAARIRVLSAKLLLPRLTRSLCMLSGGYQDAPDRHQTMRAALAWSYTSLGPAEQALFNRLAVFVGGCSVEAVEAVNPTQSGTLELLSILVDSSLIYRAEHGDGSIRFGMLEPIREFGIEQLEVAAELDVAQHAHARWVLEFVEKIEPLVRGPDQQYWVNVVDDELPNMRAALNWAIEHATDDVMGARIAGSLTWFWFTGGFVSEAKSWLVRALERATHPDRYRMKALAAAGWFTHIQQDSASAREFLEESLGIALTLEDDWYAAWTLHLLGRVGYFDGDSNSGRVCARDSLSYATRTGDEWLMAWPHHLLGLSDHIDGDYQSAVIHYERSLAIRRRINDQGGIATLLALIGLIEFAKGNYYAALDLFRQCLQLSRPLQGRWVAANLIADIVAVAVKLGEYERAAQLSGAAEELRRFVGANPIPMTEAVYLEAQEVMTKVLSDVALNAAREAGSRMGLGQAIAESLRVGQDGRDDTFQTSTE